MPDAYGYDGPCSYVQEVQKPGAEEVPDTPDSSVVDQSMVSSQCALIDVGGVSFLSAGESTNVKRYDEYSRSESEKRASRKIDA
jgi:hypothetical protein